MSAPAIAMLAAHALVERRPPARAPIGGAALENAARAAYQSARVHIGCPLPPLPLTEAQAWAEAQRARPDLYPNP